MYNPMERIRKLSGMPSMKGGVPPKGNRKVSDWAAYTDAVETVTRELVDQLMQCQAGALKIAGEKAIYAGKVAEFQEKASHADKTRALASADKVLLSHDTTTDVREQVQEAIQGNGS